jgi:hypothetical protein
VARGLLAEVGGVRGGDRPANDAAHSGPARRARRGRREPGRQQEDVTAGRRGGGEGGEGGETRREEEPTEPPERFEGERANAVRGVVQPAA